jgi:antitoxin CptB
MDERRKRIRYRAERRGFKEADLLIGGFAQARLPSMTDAELEAFEALLDLPDHELYAIAMEERAAPPEHETPVLEALRAFRAARR